MALHLQTWIKKTTGVDVVEVSLEDFTDIVGWVGQGGRLTIQKSGQILVEVYVNGETASVGHLIVKDGENFYITTEPQLKEFYNKK